MTQSEEKYITKKNLIHKNHYRDKKKTVNLYKLVEKITTFSYKKKNEKSSYS